MVVDDLRNDKDKLIINFAKFVISAMFYQLEEK